MVRFIVMTSSRSLTDYRVHICAQRFELQLTKTKDWRSRRRRLPTASTAAVKARALEVGTSEWQLLKG